MMSALLMCPISQPQYHSQQPTPDSIPPDLTKRGSKDPFPNQEITVVDILQHNQCPSLGLNRSLTNLDQSLSSGRSLKDNLPNHLIMSTCLQVSLSVQGVLQVKGHLMRILERFPLVQGLQK